MGFLNRDSVTDRLGLDGALWIDLEPVVVVEVDKEAVARLRYWMLLIVPTDEGGWLVR